MFQYKLCAHAPFPIGVGSLVYIGWLKNLAKKLGLSDQNEESCTLRNTKVIDIIYRRMRSMLPQRILMLGREAWFSDPYIYMAADMGHCEALMYYGYIYISGHDSFNIAVDYFTQAAYQGHTEAQVMVGKMLTNRRPEEAKKWMELAANKGNADAQFYLGFLYDSSHTEKAMHWYTLAAKQGHTKAQHILGRQYAKIGRFDLAVVWLRLASIRDGNADTHLLYILAENPHLCQDKTELDIITTYNQSNRSYENKMCWLCRRQSIEFS